MYLVDDISLHINFQRVYSVDERLCYYTRLITCMCVEPLIRVWFLIGLERALRMLRWLTCRLLQDFCSCKDNFNSYLFDVWPASCYPRMFDIHTYIVFIHSVRNGSLLTPFVPTSQVGINICLYMICLQLMCASVGLMSWIVLEYHSYVNLEVFVYVL